MEGQRRGSWYAGNSGQQPQQQYIGIDMSSSNSQNGSSSGYSAYSNDASQNASQNYGSGLGTSSGYQQQQQQQSMHTGTSPSMGMSLSPALRSAPAAGSSNNPGLGMARGVLTSNNASGSGSSTNARQTTSSSYSPAVPGVGQASAAPSTSTSMQHLTHPFNRTNSSGSTLSISTSPTTVGGFASPMTPSSPAYLASSSSSAAAANNAYHPQQNQYAQYQRYTGNSQGQQQMSQLQQQHSGGYASMDASPALGASGNNSGSHAASPNLVASSSDNNFRMSTSSTSAGGASSRPTLQPSHSSSSSSAYSPHFQQGQRSSYLPQQQNSHYLEDPYADRRTGSYSPSHYAIASGQASTSNTPQQYASQMQQHQQPPASPYSPVGLALNMQSPRQPTHNNTASSYFANAAASSSQAQVPYSPNTYSTRQASSLSNANAGASSSSSSATSPVYHTNQVNYPTSPQAQTHRRGGSGGNAGRHQHTQSMSSATTPSASTSSATYMQQQQRSQQQRQRPRSAGSAFKRIAEASDLRPLDSKLSGRRANPDGGTISPLKALTTQLSQTYHLINPSFRYELSLNPRRVLTKPSKPAGNDGYDNEDSDYILYVNDVLGSEGNKYLILDVLGQGTFGQVVKCQNMKTHEIVGVKVIKNKPAYYQQSMMEITILEMLNLTYDPEDKHHILRLKDTFVHCRHLCLVFELLSSNLYELIKQNAFRGLSTSLVRVFTEQLLDALCVLKDARLIHCDLKPENILLKTLQSPDIKVIDFGSACHEKQTVYTYIQSRFYRSPEVLLGLPYSTTIDMWSLGCICVELFLGLPLFPGTSEFNQITRIVEMLGLPPTYMLEQGKQVSHFFNVHYDEYGRKQWRLKSLEEYEREHPNAKEQPSKKFFAANTLPEIIKSYPNQRKGFKQSDIDREMQNRVSFIDFVQGLLNMNPMERWTPQQARQHPFVINELLRAPYVPPMGPQSSRVPAIASVQQAAAANNVNADRPYGGLPPTPARASARQYQDAASYQQHLNQQQAHVAAASASAYRQAQYSHNPYAPQQSQVQSPNQPTSFSQSQQQQQQFAAPRLPATTLPTIQTQQRVQQPPAIVHHSPSSSMGSINYSNTAMRNSSSGPLSPSIPTNPPAAHAYSSRNRSGTFSQLDVPPALQKLGLDLSSYKAIGTPQLRRDDQRAAWERRHGVDPSQLDRRRSLKQANPHLEHLEYYAQSGQPGYYYASPPSLSQPFSVVVDPRMQDPAGAAVTVPPQVYAGAPGTRYAAPPQALSMQQPPLSAGGATPYDTFDQYDLRDGLNTMLHQPLVPTSQQHQQRSANPPTAFFGNPQLQAAGMYGQVSPYGGPQSSAMKNADNLLNGDLGSLNQTSGKQRKPDAQVWP